MSFSAEKLTARVDVPLNQMATQGASLGSPNARGSPAILLANYPALIDSEFPAKRRQRMNLYGIKRGQANTVNGDGVAFVGVAGHELRLDYHASVLAFSSTARTLPNSSIIPVNMTFH